MLATVCGVGNDMGHAHGRTCKVKSPAKAMLVIFQYIVWKCYFYFVFPCGLLWMFKDIFDMETLLARLKSSMMWVASHQGCIHTHVDWPLHPTSVPVKVAWSHPAWQSRGWQMEVTWTQSHMQSLNVAEKFTGPAVLTFFHPQQNSVSSQSPCKVLGTWNISLKTWRSA